MTIFCKRRVGNEIVEYPLSMWEEISAISEFDKHNNNNDVEIKKVPTKKHLKTGREKHDFRKRSGE